MKIELTDKGLLERGWVKPPRLDSLLKTHNYVTDWNPLVLWSLSSVTQAASSRLGTNYTHHCDQPSHPLVSIWTSAWALLPSFKIKSKHLATTTREKPLLSRTQSNPRLYFTPFSRHLAPPSPLPIPSQTTTTHKKLDKKETIKKIAKRNSGTPGLGSFKGPLKEISANMMVLLFEWSK